LPDRGVLSTYQHFEDATVTDALTAATDPSTLAAIADAASSHDNNMAAILGVMIPIVAIVFGLSLAMLGIWLDYRKKRELFQLHHAERMAAIEKGLDVPALPAEFFQSPKREATPYKDLRRGLLCTLIGITVTVALWGTGEADFWWGLVPIGVGVAYLLSFLVERNRPPPAP
jgi:hypothetical protein